MNPKFLSIYILSMLSETDLFSKIIILILIVFSITSWALIFEKIFKLKILESRTDKFLRVFWSGENIHDIYKKYEKNINCPTILVFSEIMKNIDNIINSKDEIGVEYATEKAYDIMNVAISRSMQNIRSGMSIMNIIAATSTYFGLLGTVWGVSQSFKAISIMKEATLTNLAPGINSALTTTIFGLVAAIPALIAYQLISFKLNLVEENLNNFSLEFLNILSKELEADDD